DDDMRLAASYVLGPHFTADDDFSLARFIGFPDLGDTLDDAARREIRSLDDRHQFIDLHRRLIYDFECRINDFLEVMRRYFRGIAGGYSCRPVYEQIREFGRQDDRFNFCI